MTFGHCTEGVMLASFDTRPDKMDPLTFSERLRRFRVDRGLSQQDLADQLGVGKITVLRWENDTSKPSPLAATRLKEIGFGPIDPQDTKSTSIPRAKLGLQSIQDLRGDIRTQIQIGRTAYSFDPSPYVVNGPQDQLPFFETLYALQEISDLPCPSSEYARRLSAVAGIPESWTICAQYQLEKPKPNANHWNPNYGPHGWHRYVGRFPPHLVRAIINHFGARPGQIICDPFCGSGTTLVEARMLGLKAIGIDLCPLSCLISRTKSKFPARRSQLDVVRDSLSAFYGRTWRSFLDGRDPSTVSYAEILARKGNSIDAFPNCERWLTPEALLGASIVIEFACTLDGYERDVVCCALSSRMRSIGNVDVDVVRAEYRTSPRRGVDVLRLVHAALCEMASDIEATVITHGDLMSSPQDVSVIECSLLDVDVAPSSVDFIITSPPYGVESLSYLRTHLLSYRCLAAVLKYDPYTFDDRVIGSEYVRGNGLHSAKSTKTAAGSPTFGEFFCGNPRRPLTGKARDRERMMASFFDDMSEVADRLAAWLRPGGRLAFVIGNKKIGDEVIPTDRIISELFDAHGFTLDGTISHKLKCNNSNSEVPWQERVIQDEFVMVFTRRV